MTSVDTAQGRNLDTDKLEQIAAKLIELNEAKREIGEEVKALMSGGKALGFDMNAVAALVKLKDPEEYEKHMKKVDAMRTYGEVFGIDPFA